ncbi:putative metalloprotease arx1 [Saitoella coloradoensis]
MEIDKVPVPEQDNALTPLTLSKYRTAASFANTVAKAVLSRCVVGANVAELCAFGDSMIQELTGNVYKKSTYEKGIAEPTQINVNNCVKGYTPYDSSSAYNLQSSDLVKITLGVQIDGYAAITTQQTILAPNPQEPSTGAHANVICAQHFAVEAVMRLLATCAPQTPVTPYKIRTVVEDIAKRFRLQICDGSRVRRNRRFLVGQSGNVDTSEMGRKVVSWPADELVLADEAKSIDDESQAAWFVQEGECWMIDIAFSSAEKGKSLVRRHGDLKATVYTRDVSMVYNLKLKAARDVFACLQATQSVFPFTFRDLMATTELGEARTKMGVQELVTHQLLVPQEVMVEKSQKVVVSRAQTTVLVVKEGEVLRLTGGSGFPVPWVKSEFDLGTGIAARVLKETNVKIKEVGEAKIHQESGAMEE